MTNKEITFDTLFGDIKPKDKYSIAQAIIIYGAMGHGKTTLASTCSEIGKTVLINFENRISHIEETENLRIIPTSQGDFRENKRCTYDQFTKFVDYVLAKDVKIQFIILDTLDMMLQVFIKGMLKRGEISDKFYGRAEVYPRIVEYIQKLREHGTTVIMTAQENNKENETDLLIVPNFKGHINPVVDGCFYLKATENDNRVLTLKPTLGTFIKPPTIAKEKFNSIPEQLENPTWADIMAILGGDDV